ncbi:hypothetical protein BDZ91DRAFT_127139 [Kalaharituber pfeilii]|nr:hypothetical protein BDZ91DRAFT_127139 [Kalaharituber pfeilii]
MSQRCAFCVGLRASRLINFHYHNGLQSCTSAAMKPNDHQSSPMSPWKTIKWN